MSESCIHYENRSAWIDDTDLALFLAFALQSIEKIGESSLVGLRNHWREVLATLPPGCIDLGLDENVVDDDQRRLVYDVVLDVGRFLDARPLLDAAWLNSLGLPGLLFKGDISAEFLGEVCKTVSSLINDA